MAASLPGILWLVVRCSFSLVSSVKDSWLMTYHDPSRFSNRVENVGFDISSGESRHKVTKLLHTS